MANIPSLPVLNPKDFGCPYFLGRDFNAITDQEMRGGQQKVGDRFLQIQNKGNYGVWDEVIVTSSEIQRETLGG